jgi:hypothetical protein
VDDSLFIHFIYNSTSQKKVAIDELRLLRVLLQKAAEVLELDKRYGTRVNTIMETDLEVSTVVIKAIGNYQSLIDSDHIGRSSNALSLRRFDFSYAR